MSQIIEFVHDWFAEVEGAAGRLEQVPFRRGLTLRAEVHPVAAEHGRAESADLRLEGGATALHVPVSRFAVVQVHARAA